MKTLSFCKIVAGASIKKRNKFEKVTASTISEQDETILRDVRFLPIFQVSGAT